MAQIADVILPSPAYTEQNGFFINLEGRLQKAFKATNPIGNAKEDWKIFNLILKKGDGKTYKPIQELFDQATNFIEDILKNYLDKDDINILVVGHNAILRCLILLLLGKPKQGFRKIRLENASFSILNISKKDNSFKTQIECLNQTSHLNKNIPNVLNTLNIKLNVIHQCGLGKIQSVSNYNQEINASIFEFIDNLDEYINWCDFAICRCGAGTLSEISQKKRGMIMIPLPKSIDNHQYFNALFYEKNNQGKIFQEKDSIDRLPNLLKSIIDENIYEDWKEKEPPIDHSSAASLMLSEIHKDNAAI